MSFTRQLTFKSENLGRFATIVLIFDKQVDGLYTEKFPVVLRSSEFQSDGVSTMSFTYHNQPAFLKPTPLVDDTIVSVAVFQPLDFTQQTTLLVDEVGTYSFTNPAQGLQPGIVGAENGTSNADSIAFGYGYIDPNREPTPVYYWGPDVFKASANVVTDFGPVLRAYVVDGYQDGQVVKAAIPSTLHLEQDLSTLPNNSVWILAYNSATGEFTITLQA